MLRIRDPVPFWPLDPGSGKGIFWIPDLGSRIPSPYFGEFSYNFLGKNLYNSLKIDTIFFQHLKNKIVQSCAIYGSKQKRYEYKFFVTPLFHCCFWIRDPRSGMGKNPDAQHWVPYIINLTILTFNYCIKFSLNLLNKQSWPIALFPKVCYPPTTKLFAIDQ